YYMDILPRKSFYKVDPDVWDLYAGYAGLMKCGGQNEFLRYLVLQHKEHTETMTPDELKKVVNSYLEQA
ncbi:hypothetical protein LCGC14_2895940, partial [marine sediment metagenome]